MDKPLEHDIQAFAVNYLKIRLRPPFLIYAIPNGGLRDKGTAKKLKAEGVLAGVPDLHIPISRKGYLSLYVEVKRGSAAVSKNQLLMHKALRELGHLVVVCRNKSDIIKTVVEYYDEKLMTTILRELLENEIE